MSGDVIDGRQLFGGQVIDSGGQLLLDVEICGVIRHGAVIHLIVQKLLLCVLLIVYISVRNDAGAPVVLVHKHEMGLLGAERFACVLLEEARLYGGIDR